MKLLFQLAIICLNSLISGQVGIGTLTPSENAVLDVNSSNKGLMLPRIIDTSDVSNPSAGLLIYDLNSKRPVYHNGMQWNTLSVTTAESDYLDSITYTVSFPANDFVSGTFGLLSVNTAVSIPEGSSHSVFEIIEITKTSDINSIAFVKACTKSTTMSNMIIEMNFYHPGEDDPYFAVKVKNILIKTFSINSDLSGRLIEKISISPIICGFKDYVNDRWFCRNLATLQEVAY
ncbi:MAG: type VI secretion system tube protein Hcp [Saprospiraceae bacterium]|nr:type VI secretion system tube protein Hcp [Saprospiraceae bacterium]